MTLPHYSNHSPPEPHRSKLNIALNGEWGAVTSVDLLAVLNDVATVLATNFVSPPFHVTVTPGEGVPMALFGPQAHIRLTSRERHWCQHAYQFGHELCHILTNHNRLQHTLSKHFQIDEIICETASIFTVFKLEEKWRTNAPYPHWTSYSEEFHRYGKKVLAGYAKRPEGELYADPQNNAIDRGKNGYVAGKLFRLLWEHPEYWKATQSLPLSMSTVTAFLENWQQICPEREAVKAIVSVLVDET